MFVRTTDACNNITILQYEIDIHVDNIVFRNPAIFEVPSYFLRKDDDGTSRPLCI